MKKIEENDDDEKNEDKKMKDMQLLQRECIMADRVTKLINNASWIYVLDLENGVWDLIVDHDKDRIGFENVGSQLHRIGNKLWLIGGKDNARNASRINRLNNIIGIKIPSISIAWKQERLIWIGHLKNDENKQCLFQYIPKEIIQHILSFHKQNVW